MGVGTTNVKSRDVTKTTAGLGWVHASDVPRGGSLECKGAPATAGCTDSTLRRRRSCLCHTPFTKPYLTKMSRFSEKWMMMVMVTGPRPSASSNARAGGVNKRYSALASMRELNRDTRVSCFVKWHSLDLATRGCQDGA